MIALSRRLWAAALPLSVLSPLAAQAQGAPAAGAPIPDIVVTPNRVAQPIQRAGSAVSVIPSEVIERSSARSVGELLQQVPGVHTTLSGGAGGVETARVRGGESRHTLVLIDGIRLNDPSTTGREFDFSSIVLADIERIEILRGPQSALYGSDAMGGVINIITKRGRGGTRGSLQASYGAYNTKELRGTVSGGDGRVFYSLGMTGFRTDGFSAFGYRIPRLERMYGKLEDDGATRIGITGRIGMQVTDTTTVEAGGTVNNNRVEYDGFEPFPDTPSYARSVLGTGYARVVNNAFDGALRSTATVFGGKVNRTLYDTYQFGPGPLDAFRTDYGFLADRVGAEYQGDLSLGSYGLLTLGMRFERESAQGTTRNVFPFPAPATEDFDAVQETRSAFALYQHTFGDRLHLSLSGRVDQVTDIDPFVTGRATLAYEIWETGTKLRTSLGTGAKAPSLYQLYSVYGTTALVPEHSLGFDVGVDQRLFDDALRLSATAYYNPYTDLIAFADPSLCNPSQMWGCYYNLDQAVTYGVELEAEAVLNQALRLRGAYTFLHAEDATTGLALAYRPKHQAFVGLSVAATPQWTIEPRLTFVGERFARPGETSPLDAYARVDVLTDYKVTDAFTLFARAENLTDTRYEEIRDAGTAGRSIYGGVRLNW